MEDRTVAPEAVSGPVIVVVLVEPRTPGNVGAVARVMANFGVHDLRIVGGVPFDEETHKRAMHAQGVLEDARRLDDLGEALEGLDFTAATTGITNLNDKRHLRNPLTPRALWERIGGMEGTVGIVFGREDFGLYNEELARCDVVVTAPTAPDYPVLNLSHAVAVVLYEMRRELPLGHETVKASQFERDRLLVAFDDLLDVTDYPPHKVEATRVMLRRIVGRATLSEWEFHTMMGVVSRATKRIRWLEAGRGEGTPPEDDDGDCIED